MVKQSKAVRRLVRVALLAAGLCVVGPVAFYVGPVPLSLATLAVYFAAGLLPVGESVTAVGVYVLLGGIGMPVFSGFLGGPERLLGLTGGFIWGYILCCLPVSWLWRGGSRLRLLVALVAGTAALYALGTLWYMAQTGCSLPTALVVCVLPFLPGDAAKMALVCGVLPPLRRAMNQC